MSRSRSMFRLRALLPVAVLSLVCLASAQLPREQRPYTVRSGVHTNATDDSRVVFQTLVRVGGVPWMRLLVAGANLPRGSYLDITSVRDGSHQRLTQQDLADWQNGSAYFNGDQLLVRLVAAARTSGVSFTTERVEVGIAATKPLSQCGPTDDRKPSSDRAVGRAMPALGTAFLFKQPNCLITAGHAAGKLKIVQFQVPPSLADGTPVMPPAKDQYPVDTSTIVAEASGLGKDWCVFQTKINPVTKLHCGPVQGRVLPVGISLPPTGREVKVTGYGDDFDQRTRAFTQQDHFGLITKFAFGAVFYAVDTEPGNSGSPVIDQLVKKVIAVHTHGHCKTPAHLANAGTPVTYPPFKKAIEKAGCHNRRRARFTTYGTACRGSSGLPVMGNNGLPLIGQGFAVTLDNARPHTAAVQFFGLSNQNWGPIRLPFDLTGLGAPGCSILASGDLLLPTPTDRNGQSSIGYNIPNDHNLLGGQFFVQWIILDDRANKLGVAASQGGAATIGNEK